MQKIGQTSTLGKSVLREKSLQRAGKPRDVGDENSLALTIWEGPKIEGYGVGRQLQTSCAVADLGPATRSLHTLIAVLKMSNL